MGQTDLSTLVPPLNRLLRRGRIAFHALGNRGRLAALEIEETAERMAKAAVMAVAGLIAVVIIGVGLNLLVAAVFWDSAHRVTALAAMLVLEAAGLAWIMWWIWKLLRAPFLEATREQIQRDRRMLAELAKGRNEREEE